MTRFYYFLSTEQFQPEVLVKHAVLAEKAGFDGLMISEHFHPWVDDVSASGNAFPILGAIAQATKKVKLITGVTTPLFRYHPAIIAQMAATIDRLSGGRFELGVGTGEKLNEAPLGFEFPAYNERAERMEEAINIVRRMLSGKKVSMDGVHYKVDHAKLYSPPINHVPIYLAAGGPKSASLAAKMADGIITSVKDPAVTLERVISPAKSNNKDLSIVATRWTVFAKDDDEAWEAIASQRGLRAPHRDTEFDPEKLRKEADALPRDEVLDKYTIVKSAEEYIQAYKPLASDIIADTVVIQTTSVDQEKTINIIGDEVLAALRS